ncbi:YqkE family protein [Bacillus sp. 165]|uniref:YqkE family protein n=1 Tax=Bacillus sp. 165 TaxID=1529117 RepID=UPI001ADAD581|nr:YqkE family protein [Bacillus sp. 165]MBO9129790.1 YqkE family protein [Bacillus sp. 165]
MAKKKNAKTNPQKQEKESVSLGDYLNSSILQQLKQKQKLLLEQEEKKKQDELERKRKEQREREKNKSFEELLNESNISWKDFK